MMIAEGTDRETEAPFMLDSQTQCWRPRLTQPAFRHTVGGILGWLDPGTCESTEQLTGNHRPTE